MGHRVGRQCAGTLTRGRLDEMMTVEGKQLDSAERTVAISPIMPCVCRLAATLPAMPKIRVQTAV
jgi:hypothetical protein